MPVGISGRTISHRDPAALQKARQELADDIQIRSALQFAFYEQWRALRRYCSDRAIRVVGDVAIFMNYDSAEVWTHRELFRLKDDLEPEVVRRSASRLFGKTGQRWGNPLYRWDVMKQRGYEWWIQRLRWATQNCDYIRLDHFRGFDQFWEIPAADDTAVNGRWVDGPRDDLFLKLRESLGGLPFFAEDLGHITPEVHALRDRLQIPGMAVLQFGFGDEGAHMYLPHRSQGKAIYTGTHDNDTVVGWWHSGAAEHERRNAEAYAGPLRRRYPLGFHSLGAVFTGESQHDSAARLVRLGQRGPYEYSQPAWRQLAMALRSATTDA